MTPDGESERFQMRLIGAHNVINVVGAIAVAHKMGMTLQELRIPVRRIEPVPHRMQMREHGLVTIIDDAYNSNPVGSKAAVETLAMFDGIRILITPGMVELGGNEDGFNRAFGEQMADSVDIAILVGKKHTQPIVDGLTKAGFPQENIHVVGSLEESTTLLHGMMRSGDVVLYENDLPDNYSE